MYSLTICVSKRNIDLPDKYWQKTSASLYNVWILPRFRGTDWFNRIVHSGYSLYTYRLLMNISVRQKACVELFGLVDICCCGQVCIDDWFYYPCRYVEDGLGRQEVRRNQLHSARRIMLARERIGYTHNEKTKYWITSIYYLYIYLSIYIFIYVNGDGWYGQRETNCEQRNWQAMQWIQLTVV